LFGTEGLYLISTSDLAVGRAGTSNKLAEKARKSAGAFYSLGMKEMLKDRKKLSIRSHASFL
jgi:hypothetical protein